MKLKNVETLERLFIEERPAKKKESVLWICTATLICGVFLFLWPAQQHIIPQVEIHKTTEICRISKDEHLDLKKKIAQIAGSGRVSNMTIFKHLKRRIGYETMRKMSCRQHREALSILEKIEQEVMDD